MTITRPVYRLLLDGVPHPNLDERLKMISIEYSIVGEVDQLSLNVDDRVSVTNQHFPIPKMGSVVSVWLGRSPESVNMGNFYIDSWTISMPPNTLTLIAKSFNYHSRLLETNVKMWEKVTLKAIVDSIASQHQLISFIGSTYGSIEINEFQNYESDVSFLNRLANRFNAFFKIAQNKLLFLEYNTFHAFSGNILGTTYLTVTDVISWNVSYREKQEYSQVIAMWEDRFNKRYSTVSYPVSVSSKKVFRMREMFANQQDAYYAAKSKYENFERNKQYIQVECKGNPRLTAGGKVELTNFRQVVDGLWVIERVTHSLDADGFHTSFSAYRFSA